MTNTPLSLQDRRRRLCFRGWHRGIKEMDLIFGNFLDQHNEEMSLEDCDWFEILFDENDHEILGWVTGSIPVPEKYNHEWMHKMQALDFLNLRA